ncbi:MAG: HlyC/CorC family transporter [Candidatus Latescibacteria bacterium]|nr:HlyC/CorC family transporter [Candidatus Latescibacterota bacterium]
MELLRPLLVVGVLVSLNGLFVAAEFALLTAPRQAIERRAAAGHWLAVWVHRTLREPRLQVRYVATAQLGITLASLGLGMYGEHTLARTLAPHLEGLGTSRWLTAHALATLLSLGVMTYSHIVFGEMVPKSLALMHPEAAMLGIARPMRWTLGLLYPLVLALEAAGRATLRLMGLSHQPGTSNFYTPEELEYIVRESQEGGKLQPESGQVMRELFDFEALTAGQVMTPRVHLTGVPAGASLEQLRQVLAEDRHTRYPVYEEDLDHLCGVVHIKDLLRLLIAGRPLSAADVRQVAFVPETAGLDTVIEAMRRTRTQMVVVMDEHGGTAGLVVLEDLAAEMVGEMNEGTAVAEEVFRGRDGRLRAAGTLRLEELGQHLGLVLEHEEVETVSGLVLALLDRPPAVGDEVRWSGVRFRVSAIEGHGVAECVVLTDRPPT